MYSLSELSSSELQSNADVSEAVSWFLPLQISGSDGFHWKKSVMCTRKSRSWTLLTSPPAEASPSHSQKNRFQNSVSGYLNAK